MINQGIKKALRYLGYEIHRLSRFPRKTRHKFRLHSPRQLILFGLFRAAQVGFLKKKSVKNLPSMIYGTRV